MRANYHHSGLSTPEAIEDFRAHFLSQLPRAIRFLVRVGVLRPRLVMVCDGCGKLSPPVPANSVLLPTARAGVQRWRDTEWTHQHRLDFCRRCSLDGTAERAVAAGVVPLGTYTFGRS